MALGCHKGMLSLAFNCGKQTDGGWAMAATLTAGRAVAGVIDRDQLNKSLVPTLGCAPRPSAFGMHGSRMRGLPMPSATPERAIVKSSHSLGFCPRASPPQ